MKLGFGLLYWEFVFMKRRNTICESNMFLCLFLFIAATHPYCQLHALVEVEREKAGRFFKVSSSVCYAKLFEFRPLRNTLAFMFQVERMKA